MGYIFAYIFDRETSFFSEKETFICYTFAFFFSVLLSYLFSLVKPCVKKTPSMIYRIFLLVNYIIIALPVATTLGIRANGVGADTHNYIASYLRMGQGKYAVTDTLEFGFEFLHIISYKLFAGDLVGAVFPMTLLTIVCMVAAFDAWNKKRVLPIGLFLYYMIFGTLLTDQARQLLALSILSIGYFYLYNGKKARFFLFVFLAFSFHMSSVLALALLFVQAFDYRRKRVRKLYVLFALGMCFVFYYAISVFFSLLPAHYMYIMEKFSEVKSFGYKWIVDVFPFLLAIFLLRTKDVNQWGLRNLPMYCVPFRLGGYRTFYIMRLYYFPAMFSLQTISNGIAKLNKKKRTTILFLISIVFFGYYYLESFILNTHGVVPYKVMP